MIPAGLAPVRANLRIHWDRWQIPFIEAATDEDAAFGLGVVQAHLRLGQITLMRRIAAGRLAEIVGPLGIELDRTIRLLDLGRAVPATIDALPAETLAWVRAYLDGFNHVVSGIDLLPHELGVLGMQPEPWTLEDFFLTARLVCADISWFVNSRLLRARAKLGAEWPRLWPRLLAGGLPMPGEDGLADSLGLAAASVRGASNSAAVAGWRTTAGAAMIASDPHLGLSLPSLFFVAGVHSPSIHAVGLMLPGMPFLALGRNQQIAWGGTSLHAASSEFIDVSDLAPQDFQTETVTLAVRGAGRRDILLRRCAYGPVVSDGLLAKGGPKVALRWVGHAASDELTAMLGVMRSGNFAQFADALDGFAVPGQMMVFAGADGSVGSRVAAHLPRRSNAPPEDIVLAREKAWELEEIATGAAMPRTVNPADGIIASANDSPPAWSFPFGFFYSPGDRAARLRSLLDREGLEEADMRALQQDTIHPGGIELRDRLVSFMPEQADQSFREALLAWSGEYAGVSRGALAFELLFGFLAEALSPEGKDAFAAVWTGRRLLLEEFDKHTDAERHALVASAAAKAAPVFARWKSWGRVHRHHPGHVFAAIPVLGARYRLPDFPAEGGNDTINKTGTPLVTGPHRVGFGACARHVSDLSDPDANRFVVFGGQDGWLGSENFADQLPLWRRGEYVTVPMTLERVREQALVTTEFSPG